MGQFDNSVYKIDESVDSISTGTMQTILALAAAAAYLITVGFSVRTHEKVAGVTTHLLAIGAATMQFAFLWLHPDVGAWWIMCGVTLVMVIVYLVLARKTATVRLGLVVFSAAAIVLLVTLLFGSGTATSASPPHKLHLTFAVITYAFLALSFVQACIYMWQEKLTRTNPLSAELEHMPALESSESLLFWFVRIGFTILTVALIAGIYFTSRGPSLLPVNHHTILSIMSWLCFALLLAGRHFRGWRGQRAANWTLTGFAVLALAYFGTRFVADFLLA